MRQWFVLVIGLIFFNSQSALAEFFCDGIFEPSTFHSIHPSGKIPEFKRANPTARKSFETYPQPNKRGLKHYNQILPTELQKLVKPGFIVIDLGGGRGYAMFELAEATGAHTIVINTQRNLEVLSPKHGRYEYRSGWVEEVLPEYHNQVNIIVDLWGAFSYSINKKEILESIWKALKPGGEALIFYSHNKTPAHIHHRGDRNYRIDRWLKLHFPEYFKIHDVPDAEDDSVIIQMTKPENAPENLELSLIYKHHTISPNRAHHWPTVHYLDFSLQSH